MLVNAQLLAEGWNSPRATVCMHLAPTASRRIYQQRVGRVTRRQPGKEAGIVVDFVHPATKHDDPVVTLHSLLDRDVYRGGAIVVGPVRRGRGRRLRVERRVLPVTADENRRIEVFERELWRIAVEHLDYGEQVQWAALAGARVAPNGWRRARAMLHFDQGGELKRTFLTTAVERNKNPQLRLKALQEIASGRDAEAFDRALDFVESWPRDDKREGVKVVLQALAEKKIGRRDQANNWIWRCANMTREVHEEYAVQRWPETKRLLGLLVNSSGGAHARNARRLVHAARQQDRRLAAALLAAALPHTAEAGEVVNGARTRMSRKPAALARELLRNFPKGRGKSKRRRRKKPAGEAAAPEVVEAVDDRRAGRRRGAARPRATAPPKKPARARRRSGRRSRAGGGRDRGDGRGGRGRDAGQAGAAPSAPQGQAGQAAGEARQAGARAAAAEARGDAGRVARRRRAVGRRARGAGRRRPSRAPSAPRPSRQAARQAREGRRRELPEGVAPPAKRATPRPPEPNLLEAASERVRAAVREAVRALRGRRSRLARRARQRPLRGRRVRLGRVSGPARSNVASEATPSSRGWR